MEAVNEFALCYSSVHRGAGRKAERTSEMFDSVREYVADFFNVSKADQTVLFTRNTTESINRLSNILASAGRKTVLVSGMEHHSNDLPWRRNFNVVYINTDRTGRLDLNDFEEKCRLYSGDLRLVAVTGASNVTGYVNPIYEIAVTAHRCGAEILVDAAQLAPHMRVNMNPPETDRRIDYMAFSGHKLYAPFGTGVLIGNKHVFENNPPDLSGGGTADIVTYDSVVWHDIPLKYEAGTPNVMGIVALGAALRTLNDIGMGKVHEYEQKLAAYAYRRLSEVKNICIYSDQYDKAVNIGVIPFNIYGIHHSELAAHLAFNGGIDVRSGCFCAQPYVQKLLDISSDEVVKYSSLSQDKRPGMVRVSFGLYNTEAEIDHLYDVLADC
jgi:selenocysteine lyase/cysteine desulfurase